MQRRSLLKAGMVSAALPTLSLLSKSLAGPLKTRSDPSPSPSPSPLQLGSRFLAVNAGTWIDPDTDFSSLVERCEA